MRGKRLAFAAGCTTVAYELQTARKEVLVAAGNVLQASRFCGSRRAAATQGHFADEAGILHRLAFACGPSQTQSSSGTADKLPTAARNLADIFEPSASNSSMSARKLLGNVGSKNHRVTRWCSEGSMDSNCSKQMSLTPACEREQSRSDPRTTGLHIKKKGMPSAQSARQLQKRW